VKNHLIVYTGLDGHTYVKWISHRDWERLIRAGELVSGAAVGSATVDRTGEK
jgi:hypothetical protein